MGTLVPLPKNAGAGLEVREVEDPLGTGQAAAIGTQTCYRLAMVSTDQQPDLQDALRATPYIRPSRWYSWHWSSGVHGEMAFLIPNMEHLSCLSFHGQILSFKQRLRSKRAGVIIETS